jgi:hypothetical protein
MANRSATKGATKKTDAPNTTGFGCPEGVGVHHFVVQVPRGSTKPVTITEEFGLSGADAQQAEAADRVVLPRSHWKRVSTEVKRVFNERLKKQGLATAAWKAGDNRVDRLLGRELTVLAWAIEAVEEDEVPQALRNWLALKPEERWWLYGMTVAGSGGINDTEQGWRVALRYALARASAEESVQRRRSKAANPSRTAASAPDLFTTTSK